MIHDLWVAMMRTQIEERRKMGHRYIMLTVKRKTAPKSSRILLGHGVYGRGVNVERKRKEDPWTMLVEVTLDDAEKFVDRSLGKP